MSSRSLLPSFLLVATTMVSAQSIPQLARTLADAHDRHKLLQLTSRRFTQTDMLGWIEPMRPSGTFSEQQIGRSAEGRPLVLITVGQGPTRVLLWSQMHGDESTATMALLDILSFFAADRNHPVVTAIRDRLTVLMLPMINPDGAERFQRRTAQHIDMNRDALAMRTPEARALWNVRNTYTPAFGFNLHDQSPRYTVGPSSRVTAISLLAPAVDHQRTVTPGRLRAQHVAAVLAEVFESLAPGHTARYDDSFEPRAFGDNIQKSGTSTVLVESGGWPDDPEKQFLRKMNFIGLLAALHAIASGTYEQSPLSAYEELPFNSENLYDLIVRNVLVVPGGTADSIRMDVGINFELKADSAHSDPRWYATVADLGDLSTFGAFEERDGSGLTLDAQQIAIEQSYPREELEKILARK